MTAARWALLRDISHGVLLGLVLAVPIATVFFPIYYYSVKWIAFASIPAALALEVFLIWILFVRPDPRKHMKKEIICDLFPTK